MVIAITVGGKSYSEAVIVSGTAGAVVSAAADFTAEFDY